VVIYSRPVFVRSSLSLALKEVWEEEMRRVTSSLLQLGGEGAGKVDLLGRGEGIDLFGDPVVYGEFSLRYLPGFRFSMEEIAVRSLLPFSTPFLPPLRSPETNEFRGYISLSFLHWYDGRRIVEKGSSYLLLSAWVSSPQRFHTPSLWEGETKEWMRLMPMASSFAEIVTQEDTFTFPTTQPSSVLIVVGDGTGTIQGDEIQRLVEGMVSAVTSAGKDRAVLHVGFVKSCDPTFSYLFPPGESPFLSSPLPVFEEKVRERLLALFGSAPCYGNRLLYTVGRILKGENGLEWRNAQRRWVVFLTERDDESPCPEDPPLGSDCPRIRDYVPLFQELKVESIGVAPFSSGCKNPSVKVFTQASLLGSVIQEMGGVSIEYCDDFSTPLREKIREGLLSLVSLRLRKTPFPGTVSFFFNGKPLEEDPLRTVKLRKEDLVIVPGPAFSEEGSLSARYLTILEPTPNR
jgi:hypothetical protein